MSNIKTVLITVALASIALYIGLRSNSFDAGEAGVRLYTGASNAGEVNVATSGSEIVPRSDRLYLKVCKTSLTNPAQITLAINASPSHGRGLLLDSRVPCWESNDLNLITGEINGVASPSAASVSYMQW